MTPESELISLKARDSMEPGPAMRRLLGMTEARGLHEDRSRALEVAAHDQHICRFVADQSDIHRITVARSRDEIVAHRTGDIARCSASPGSLVLRDRRGLTVPFSDRSPQYSAKLRLRRI